MDIAALSIALSQSQVISQAGTAVLAMSLDHSRQESASLMELMDASVKAMEQSVHPNLGGNIDITV